MGGTLQLFYINIKKESEGAAPFFAGGVGMLGGRKKGGPLRAGSNFVRPSLL